MIVYQGAPNTQELFFYEIGIRCFRMGAIPFEVPVLAGFYHTGLHLDNLLLACNTYVRFHLPTSGFWNGV